MPAVTPNRTELSSVLQRFRREFWLTGFFSLVANLLMLTPSLYMLQVYDRVMVSQNGLTLLALSAITLFLLAGIAFAEWARGRLLVHVGLRLARELNRRVFTATFNARLNRSEERAIRHFGDLTNLRQFLTGPGIIAFFDAPWTPIYLLVLYLLHPMLGLIGLIGATVIAAMAWLNNRHIRAPVQAVQEAQTQEDIYLQSKLRNADVVEAMGMQASLLKRWLQRHSKYIMQSGQAGDLENRLKALTKFIRLSLQSLILGAGALLVIDGVLTPWIMIVGGILLGRALAPIEAIIAIWRQITATRDAYRRLGDLLVEYPVSRDRGCDDIPVGEVQLRNLTAKVPGSGKIILDNINLEITAGEVLGIVGPSGSGKSTLARCLLGIWPEAEGEILLDKKSITLWPKRLLGRHLGYLPQDVQLFDGSVAQNIARMGKIDSEGIIQAAQLAGVHELVLRLPRGYDTPVGRAGNYLSGGQRQRIGLARAIYGIPQILVLDEPNANLDEIGERALRDAILALKTLGRTVVLITHRRNILAVTDRILSLDNGRITWQGPSDSFLTAPVSMPNGHATA